MSWVSDFRQFIMRGNVVDMAVGVAIGTAFTAIVNSLVGDIITPFVSGLMGGTDFSQLTFQFGNATIAYGNFIQAIINFIFIALVIFLVIRWTISLSTQMGMDTSELEGIVPDSSKEKEEEPEPEPEATEEVVLLTEIRDLMRAQADGGQRAENSNQ